LLYVKEAHKVRQDAHYEGFVVTYQDGTEVYFNENELSEKTVENLLNRKTLNTNRFVPGMYMPKDLARIWLRVKEVRVERLQVISEDDAKAEGMMNLYKSGDLNQYWNIRRFMKLWASINGLDSWNKNPWVWVVVYEVVSITGKSEIETCPCGDLIPIDFLDIDTNGVATCETCANEMRKEAING
jgi:hypothetical protein